MIYEIKELIDFIENDKHNLNVRLRVQTFGPKRKQLYLILKSKPELQDSDICMSIYNKPSSSAYVKLKTRLYQNLIDIILISSNVNTSQEEKFRDVRNKCLRNVAVLQLLTTRALYRNIIYLGKITLKSCAKYELNDIAYDTCKVLLNLYGSVYRNESKFEKLRKDFLNYRTLRDQEDDIQLKFYHFFNIQKKLKKKTKEELKLLFQPESLNRVNSSKEPSFKSKYYSYLLLCMYYEAISDFKKQFLIAEQSINYIIKKHSKNSLLLTSPLNYKFAAAMKIRDSKILLQTLEMFENVTKRGSIEYDILNIYYTLIYLHEKDYYTAISYLSNLRKQTKKKQFSAYIDELTSILTGYLSFTNIVLEIDHSEFTNFKVAKLLNNVPKYSKDKRGQNTSILILQILFLIEKKKYGQIIDYTDALKQYSYRHLRRNDTFRSNCFIKMLLQIPKAEFNPIRTERYTKDLYAKLQTVPLELSDQPMEVEIIPYEDLWEIILKLLERNSKIKRGRPRKK